ncbi:MAG: DedA family protein [Sphingomonadaceae bacterium]|nr:DedA family protein [Sphingomonadaceae bacterium]
MHGWLPHFIAHWHYFAVWAMMAVECFVPIFPAEVVIPVATLIATRGTMSVPGVLVAGVLGSLSGTSVWYAVSRALGRERFDGLVFRYGHVATVRPHQVARIHKLFERWGAALVCVGRLLPGVRALISIPAGIARMPIPKFLLWSAVGISIWIGVLTYAGWLVRGQYLRIERFVSPIATAIIASIVILWIYRLLTWRRA